MQAKFIVVLSALFSVVMLLVSSVAYGADTFGRGYVFDAAYNNQNYSAMFSKVFGKGVSVVRQFVTVPGNGSGNYCPQTQSDIAQGISCLNLPVNAQVKAQLVSLLTAANAMDTTLVPAYLAANPLDHRTQFNLVITFNFQPSGAYSLYWPANNATPTTLTANEQSVIALFTDIAAKAKGYGVHVWFDLINEPVPHDSQGNQYGPTTANIMWRSLAIPMIQAIRQQDPNRGVVVEPAPWGAPSSFATFGQQLPSDSNPFPKVMYSMHFYTPYSLTQQGVSPLWPNPLTYPPGGKVASGSTVEAVDASGVSMNAQIGTDLQTVDNWLSAHNLTSASMYVGEMSCARWAPNNSAYNWLTVVDQEFEQRHWSWTYLSYDGADEWRTDIPSNISYTSPPTASTPVPSGGFLAADSQLYQIAGTTNVPGAASISGAAWLSIWQANYTSWIWGYYSCGSSTVAPNVCPSTNQQLLGAMFYRNVAGQ